MPPSSSSGWAVTIRTLARVRSFCRLWESAAAPLSNESGCAAARGSELTPVGDWALIAPDRNRKSEAHATAAATTGSNLMVLDAIHPPWRAQKNSGEMFRGSEHGTSRNAPPKTLGSKSSAIFGPKLGYILR